MAPGGSRSRPVPAGGAATPSERRPGPGGPSAPTQGAATLSPLSMGNAKPQLLRRAYRTSWGPPVVFPAGWWGWELTIACLKDTQTTEGAVGGPGCPGHHGYHLPEGRRVRKTGGEKGIRKI